MSQVQAQGEAGQSYTVQHDDTLWKVAEKYLADGNRYTEIVAATRAKHTEDSSFASVENPNIIVAGTKLWIPAGASALPEAEVIEAEPSPAAPAQAQAPASSLMPDSAAPAGRIAFSFWNNAPERCTYEINVIEVDACYSKPDRLFRSRAGFLGLTTSASRRFHLKGKRLAFRGWGGIPEKHNGGRDNHPYFNCPGPQADRHLGHTTLDGTDYYEIGIFFEDSQPDWSPNGQQLLFETGRNGDGIVRIMTISADGSDEGELRITGQQPSWAPDSSRFVYRGCDLTGNRCGLWLATALPVEAWDLGINMLGPLLEEPAAAHPDWSPVDDRIVYQSPAGGSWDLYLIDADGNNRRQLTSDGSVEGLPTWSPDGQWIAYLSDSGGNWGIWIIRPDGSNRQLLFPFDGGSFTPLAVTPYYNRDWIDEQISWGR